MAIDELTEEAQGLVPQGTENVKSEILGNTNFK